MEDYLITIAGQITALFLPFFVLGFFLHQVERGLAKALHAILGQKSILLTGWIGTPLHELSHLILCPVFLHEVKEVKFFTFDEKSGTLGYVRHSFNPKSFYQVCGNFFIGAAPLFGGALCLWALSAWLLPGNEISPVFQGNALSNFNVFFDAVGNLLEGIWAAISNPDVLSDWRFWLFVYLALCISSHLAPSSADFEGGAKGFFCFLFLMILVFSTFYFLDKSHLIESFIQEIVSPLALLLLFALFISLILFLVLKPIAFLRGG